MISDPKSRVSERREYRRYDVAAQIRLKHSLVNYIMDVSDISLSGAFVATEKLDKMPWFKVGEELEMEIFTTEDLENIKVIGMISRVESKSGESGQGFGVQFTSINDFMRAKLTTLLDSSSDSSHRPPPLPTGSGS